MPRNIVVCCDGTSNEPAHDMTNVAKLYFALTNDPANQITFYHPGLGTMEPPGALTWFDRWWTTTLGLAAGRGIQDDIRDAYVFLSDYYCSGDNLFLFGFSRGAYTARAVTGLLKMYGLIEPGNAPLAPYAIRMMFAINDANRRNDADAAKKIFGLATQFREAYCRVCKPHFVGLWDTVSSVGWFAHPTSLPYTANSPDISLARHAIAIDERRAFFQPNLWRPSETAESGPKDLRQVWFPGSHSDVGGGYSEGPQSAQSKYALEWIMVEARKAGLIIDQDKALDILGRSLGSKYQAANVSSPVHETLTGFWKLLEFVPRPYYDFKTHKESRRANLFRRRVIPPGSFIHQSAYLRGESYWKSRIPADAKEVEHPILN
jgi:uncharacterized protein (DUF2235 family)